MNRLRMLRKERDLYQEDVAKVIGVTTACYSYYELGKRQMSQDILTKLAVFFDTSIDYILGNSDDRSIKSSDSEINIGLSAKEYNTLTEVQKQQIRAFAEFVKNQNKK